jgi:hypothetical protein
MTPTIPECPACRVKMDEGGVFATTQHGPRRLAWTEGRPEKGRFTGTYALKGLKTLPLVSFRCPRCGWVIWFAPEITDGPQ